MSKNAKRRHHINRLKHKRSRDLVVAHITDESIFSPNSSKQKHIARHFATPKSCSCSLCSNPRKFYGNSKDAKTLQEQKAINDTIFQLDAIQTVA